MRSGSSPRECGTREQRDKLTDNGVELHNAELYARMADLGWLGVAIPEEYGGSGGGLVEQCLFQEIFRGLVPVGAGPATRSRARSSGLGPRRKSRDAGRDLGRRSTRSASPSPRPGRTSARSPAGLKEGERLSAQRPEDVVPSAHIASHILSWCRTSRATPHEGLTMLSVATNSTGWRSAGSTRWAAVRSTTCS